MAQVISELHAAAQQQERQGNALQAVACRLEAAVARQFQGKDELAREELPAIVRQAAEAGARETEVRALELEARLYFYRRNELVPARERIERAIRVGRGLDPPRWFAEACVLRAELDQAQGDLAAAYTTIGEALGLGVEDDRFLCFAYASLCSICLDVAKLADHREPTPFYVQMAERAVDAARKMQEIATRRGWTALQSAGGQYGKSASQRILLLKQQLQFQGTQKDFQRMTAEPQRPEDVIVSESFGVGGPAADLPPELLALTEEAGFRYSSDATRLYVQAQMDLMMSKLDEALGGFRGAVELLEKQYGSLSDEGARRSLLSPRIDYYYTPMLILLEQKRFAEAFELFEASRARVLSDLLATKEQIRLADPVQRRLYEALRDIRGRLRDLLAAGDASAVDVRKLESAREEVLQEIRQKCPQLLTLTTAAPVALQEVQKAATEGGYDVLAYSSLDSQLIVWHIGPTGVHVRSVLLFQDHLADKVAVLRATLVDPRVAFDEKTARQLHLLLVQPMLQFISTEHVVVIPHQDLFFLPFQALCDHPNGRFLGEKYAFSYAPTTRVLLNMPPAKSLAGASVLALVGPDLAEAPTEASDIVRLYPKGSRAVPLADSTPTYLARMCGGYDVIHIAAHGTFDANSPMQSCVLLAGADGQASRLTAADMFGLSLERARLVTLSACETGRVEGIEAGEVLGIPRALLYAGADAVYLSRWKVDSPTTLALMQAFYQEAASVPLHIAAQRAALKIKGDPRTSHPFFWAAFDLVGH